MCCGSTHSRFVAIGGINDGSNTKGCDVLSQRCRVMMSNANRREWYSKGICRFTDITNNRRNESGIGSFFQHPHMPWWIKTHDTFVIIGRSRWAVVIIKIPISYIEKHISSTDTVWTNGISAPRCPKFKLEVVVCIRVICIVINCLKVHTLSVGSSRVWRFINQIFTWGGMDNIIKSCIIGGRDKPYRVIIFICLIGCYEWACRITRCSISICWIISITIVISVCVCCRDKIIIVLWSSRIISIFISRSIATRTIAYIPDSSLSPHISPSDKYHQGNHYQCVEHLSAGVAACAILFVTGLSVCHIVCNRLIT